MYLRLITLENYRSVAEGAALALDRLGRFNFLIGPNNSGKSTVLRFLQVVASLVGKKADMPIRIAWEQVDRAWWWQSNVENPIRSELVFETPAPAHDIDVKAPGRFDHDGEWRVTITITAHPPVCCTVLVAPNVYINGGWHPIVRNVAVGSSDFENLNRLGEYVSSSSTDACPYRPGAIAILEQWAKGTRFYDPVRAVDREGGRRGLIDGSDLLKMIRARQLDQKQAFDFESFRQRLIGELNALLIEPSGANPIESFEIKGEEKLDLYFKKRGDQAPIALQYMGTGIAELTILLADFLQSEHIKQYFIEEPESHLHPGLLRRLMVRLRRLTSAQFFVTTHSNAILDSTTGEDSIYRFEISPASGTSVQRCSDIIERSGILDALGLPASSLLQTNSIIWVEGPSDRIYLKMWISRLLEKQQLPYIEGTDFSFVYYGGKVLSHFTFAGTGREELIELIRVCRYSAVVMDRDTDPEDPTEEVRETKARVRDEALKDPHHRVAIFTTGREIENDVDAKVFYTALSKLLKIDREILSSLSLTGKARYSDEIVTYLNLTEEMAKTAKRKLKDKVALAELVAAEWTDEVAAPGYIDELVNLVKRSRLA